MLHSGDKKVLAKLAAAVAVVVVAIAVVTTVLMATADDSETLPTVSVQAGDELVRAEPSYWCALDMTDCRPTDPRQVETLPVNVVRAPAPIGSTVLVSVPHEVAEGPWMAIAQYATPRGVYRAIDVEPSERTYTKKFPTRPDAVLLGVEVWSVSTVLQNAPDGIESLDGSILMRGTYTIDTVPDHFQIPNSTELPDRRN
ncbi:DUF2771 domain-containing protein [Gordonia sp. HY002]|uniref:DUF2771 family protein n=1 Tax=Gordonia zhenghanii TaxID=2911516 RepID=UPI001EF00FC0|nr:DUF2771 family protein [Gordonia zhenghanii]MCF8568872.1 DUF2771 domain-containing protein [Gordonia zhenghanii]MCF8602258.1 DUF2771 domain-containing protein [Gordonia zhenghanii]